MADENTDNAQSNESNGKTECAAPFRDAGAHKNGSGSFPWDEDSRVIKKEMDQKKSRSGI